MRATQLGLPSFLHATTVIARFMRATHFLFAKEIGSPAFAGDDNPC
jgi:hypothetical protein